MLCWQCFCDILQTVTVTQAMMETMTTRMMTAVVTLIWTAAGTIDNLVCYQLFIYLFIQEWNLLFIEQAFAKQKWINLLFGTVVVVAYFFLQWFEDAKVMALDFFCKQTTNNWIINKCLFTCTIDMYIIVFPLVWWFVPSDCNGTQVSMWEEWNNKEKATRSEEEM